MSKQATPHDTAPPRGPGLGYILAVLLPFQFAVLYCLMVQGTRQHRVDIVVQSQASWHPQQGQLQCSSNGCPSWPSSNVTAQMLQQLPRTVRDLVKTYKQTSWVGMADVTAAIKSPNSMTTAAEEAAQACQSAKYLVMDDIDTTSGLGFSMITMVPLALQVSLPLRLQGLLLSSISA